MPKRLIEGKDGPSPLVGMKRFLDSHPFSALVAFSVSVATIIAGVMNYVTSQRLDAAETRHQAEMHELAAKDEKALLNETIPLKQIINELTLRFSSIERRIPGTGPTYFDVSSVMVGPETIKTLSAKYKPFSGGDFYVAVPEMGSWSYDETTEFDFLSSVYDFFKSNRAQLETIMGNSALHVWRGKSELKFQGTDNTSIEHPTFTFFPAITVQKVTKEFIKTRLSAMQKMADQSDETTDKKKAQEAVDQLSKRRADINQSNKPLFVGGYASNSDASDNKEVKKPVQGNDTGKDALQTVERKDEILENLSSAYSADDASYFLLEYLASAMQQQIDFGAHHRIYSTQKKGNVLYLEDRITFQNVQVYDGEKFDKTKQNVVVDGEVFYFGNGAEGYLVKIYLPPTPDRSDAFAWTINWLTGLQIPRG